MPSKITTAPASEPLSLPEAKLHLRIDDDVTIDDSLINDLIAAAREDAELITRRALVTQKWQCVLDTFPAPGMNISSANWYGPQWGVGPGPLSVTRVDGKTGFEIYLLYPPLQTVDSITYIDQNGAQQTLANTEYIVDNVSEPARITPGYGKTWPATQNQINAVTIAFTCGYASAEAVPRGIVRWMKLRVSTLYENREEVALLNRGTIQFLPYVDTLLDAYRVIVY
jgi:hypothetical protein